MGWVGMGWDGMGWRGVRRDGVGGDGVGGDGVGWGGVGWDGMGYDGVGGKLHSCERVTNPPRTSQRESPGGSTRRGATTAPNCTAYD